MGQSPLLRKAHLCQTGLSLVWSLMGQSPLLCRARLLETGLSLIRSLMGQSHLLCNAYLLEMGLSQIRSLMGQSHMLCNAHLIETGISLIRSLRGQSHLLLIAHLFETALSLIQSLMHGLVSSVVQGPFAGDDSFSDLESLTLIALSCNPKLSPTGQHTAKHNGLYPLLSVSLTVVYNHWTGLVDWFKNIQNSTCQIVGWKPKAADPTFQCCSL